MLRNLILKSQPKDKKSIDAAFRTVTGSVVRKKRKLLLVAAAILLIGPAIGWFVLYKTGYVAAPGKHVVPPFNMSDRIATINVEENDSGELVATFGGWKNGTQSLTSDEFFKELQRRKKNIPQIYKLIDVTSFAGFLWVVFGFAAQVVFTARMVVQWRASEKVKSSVVPPAFWWLSLLGASMLLIYFLWRKDPVGFFGQATGWFIYIRNLWFIYGKKAAC